MRAHRLASLFTGTLCGVLCCSALMGCTPDEEKITRAIQEHLDRCKKAEGDVTEIKLPVDNNPMLIEACSEPVTDVVVNSGIEATAKTGPYTWRVDLNSDSGVWIPEEVKWEDFHYALSRLEDNDSDDAVLADAAQKLADAQAAYPKSAHVRLKRLEALLRLRKVLRRKVGDKDPNGLGQETEAYYTELLAWSAANDQKDLAAEVSVMIVDYFKGLDRFLDDSIDTLGYGDASLETSISVAQKEKDEESEAAYRKELEESRAKRPAQLQGFEVRKAAVKARLCKELGGLDAEGIKDGDLKARAVAIKGSVDCTAAPAAPTATP